VHLLLLFIAAVYYYVHLTTFFSRTTLVSRHQKGKPFWFLLQQKIMGWQWQWHQLDPLHLAPDLAPCQYLTTQFLRAGCPSCRPTNGIKVLKAAVYCTVNGMKQL